MKLAVLSDLHLEFDRAAEREQGRLRRGKERKTLEGQGHPHLGPNLGGLLGDKDNCRVDAVLLAGDIDVGLQCLDYGVELSAWLDRPVVQIAGNHEFYGMDMADFFEGLPENQTGKHHFLEKQSVVLETPTGAVRILGCMLWTDFGLFGDDRRLEAMRLSGRVLVDFTDIRLDGKEFTPGKAMSLFEESRDWLEAELSQPFSGETVVMTHHAPSRSSIAKEYGNDPVSAAFASDLEALIRAYRPALWVHGHTHASADYQVGRTRVVCNPRGYRGRKKNKRFKADCIYELG